MTATVDMLAAIAPQFAEVDETRFGILRGLAELRTPACPWGTKRDWGVTYLIAHMLASDSTGASGAAGPVTSEAIGDLERSYGKVELAAGEAGYGTTSYGIEYLNLRRSLLAGPLVT